MCRAGSSLRGGTECPTRRHRAWDVNDRAWTFAYLRGRTCLPGVTGTSQLRVTPKVTRTRSRLGAQRRRDFVPDRPTRVLCLLARESSIVRLQIRPAIG